MYRRITNTYTNMKRRIRLKESELKRMISESVKRVLNEAQYGGEFGGDDNHGEMSSKHIMDTVDDTLENMQKHGIPCRPWLSRSDIERDPDDDSDIRAWVQHLRNKFGDS